MDLRKVWKALNWLKQNNHLYEKIILPSFENRNELLNNLKDTEFQENDNFDLDTKLQKHEHERQCENSF